LPGWHCWPHSLAYRRLSSGTTAGRSGSPFSFRPRAPDGSELAWAGSDARIRVARSDGTIVRILPTDIDYELVWSPDGRYLLGWTGQSRRAMAVKSSDGSGATAFIPMQGTSRSHWSWQRQAPE
jgi:hypothetical protein